VGRRQADRRARLGLRRRRAGRHRPRLAALRRAWCHGIEAAGQILRGWEAEAGRPATDVPYWDAVAALASPPDMGWFPISMALQGRPDLTREVMLERRDAFLDAALRG